MLPFRFDQPLWLLLLLLLPLVWQIGRRSLAGLPPFRCVLALALRLFFVTLCVLALARLQWNRAGDEVAVYFLADLSASIPPEEGEDARAALHAMASRKPPTDQAGLVYYAANAVCEQPPSVHPLRTRRQAVVDPHGTDIEAALRLAASTFPPAVRKRVVLATDGNQNRGDALGEIERLRAAGIQVDVLPVTYRHEREFLLERATLPDRIQPGVPTELRVLARSTYPVEARLLVEQDGRLLEERRVHLREGRNRMTVPVVLDDAEGAGGVQSFRVTLLPVEPDDDTIPDNNTAHAFTRVSGPPSILYIDGNLGTSPDYQPVLYETLVRRLRLLQPAHGETPGITLVLRDAYNIPDAARLAAFDAIILDNVSAPHLGAGRMETIRSLVNAQGTGLVMIGGEHAYALGNYHQTPIEAALPVDMDLRDKEFMPNGALMLVIDRSGSMMGSRLDHAKAAAWAAVDALGPHDYVGIAAFDTQIHWVLKPTPASDRARIRRLIGTITPGGGTDILLSLRETWSELAAVPAGAKHLILLSDGISDTTGYQRLMRQVSNAGITVSAIGIEDPSGQDFLRAIAHLGGGNYYFVQSAHHLPRILIQETQFVKRAAIFEETFTPAVTNRLDDFLRELPGAGLPPLHGYVATTAKPAADVPLVSTNENRDPILAHWRYGLGRAVAFTSDAKNRWARDWIGSETFAAFWAGLVRRTLRQEPTALRLQTRIEGTRGTVTVHAFDEDGNPLPFLDLALNVTEPGGGIQRVRLRQSGLSTYEGEFPATHPGAYYVTVFEDGRADGRGQVAHGGVAKAYSEESLNLEADERMLHRMAETGGGMVIADSDRYDAFRREGLAAGRDFQDVWTYLLVLVAALFPVDVFIRRVMVDTTAIRKRLGAMVGRWQGRSMLREERVSRLMAAKEKAIREREVPTFLRPPMDGTDDATRGGRAKGVSTDRARPMTDGARGVGRAADSAARGSAKAPGAGGASGGGKGAASGTGGAGGAPAEETYTERLLRIKRELREKEGGQGEGK